MGADESPVKRFLCSDLVTLSAGGRSCFVNLEEIWRTGALVECEEQPQTGPGLLTLERDSRESSGIAETQPAKEPLGVIIENCEKHEFGCRAELRFVDWEWTPEFYTPAHLTDVENVAAKARGQQSGD